MTRKITAGDGIDDRGAMAVKLDADRARLLLDDEMLDRIITNVGKTPTKPDRDALRWDLLNCYRLYSLAVGPGRAGFNRHQINRLNSIQKHAKKLTDLLKADAADLRLIPTFLLPQIVFLVEAIDKMPGMHRKPADIAEWTNARLGTLGSPRQSLLNALAVVYSKHFGKEATISRNHQSGAPGGPYVRFAGQVLVEFDIECSNETIASVAHGKILKK